MRTGIEDLVRVDKRNRGPVPESVSIPMFSLRSRRSTDRIAPSEGADDGSIPSESTG